MARVFISFVDQDRNIAQAIQALLLQQLRIMPGDVFVSTDQTQVLAGDNWLEGIRRALKMCEVVILMLSARSMRSPWINYEAGAAWILDRPVIPGCFGNASKKALPDPYGRMQALQLPADAHYLVASVHRHLKLPGKPPPSMAGVTTPIVRNPYSELDSALRRWSDDPAGTSSA